MFPLMTTPGPPLCWAQEGRGEQGWGPGPRAGPWAPFWCFLATFCTPKQKLCNSRRNSSLIPSGAKTGCPVKKGSVAREK